MGVFLATVWVQQFCQQILVELHKQLDWLTSNTTRLGLSEDREPHSMHWFVITFHVKNAMCPIYIYTHCIFFAGGMQVHFQTHPAHIPLHHNYGRLMLIVSPHVQQLNCIYMVIFKMKLSRSNLHLSIFPAAYSSRCLWGHAPRARISQHTLESKMHLHYTVEYFDRKWKMAVGKFR